ncbi:MAG: hypothetical protein VKQ33_13720 [Candidatus Sericytochromatia bacterium]|nr:hypothetical protein [Candidatus Sericytochromatia bacterium]
MSLSSPRLRVSLALALLVSACQEVAPGGPAATQGKAPSAGRGAGAAATNPALDGEGAPEADAQGDAAALAEELLKTAPAVAIQAAKGGTYRSADGALAVTLPPGALTEDATVRFARADTADTLSTPYARPGISFAMDLGGARVSPDRQLTVTALADAGTIAFLRQQDPAFSLDKYSLTEVDGQLHMTMAVKGPVTASPSGADAPGETPDAWALAEFGGLPLPPPGEVEEVSQDVPAAPLEASRLALFGLLNTLVPAGRVPPGPTAGRLKFEQVFGVPAPVNPAEFNFYEYGSGRGGSAGYTSFKNRGALDPRFELKPQGRQTKFSGTPGGWRNIPLVNCYAQFEGRPIHHVCWFQEVAYEAGIGRGECVGDPQPVPLAAKVVWTSDDPRIASKPAVGAIVRFDMPGSSKNGPTEVVADDAGRAATHVAAAGEEVRLTPYTLMGPRSGRTVVASVQAGMPDVALTLPKDSPRVTFEFDNAGTPLGGAFIRPSSHGDQAFTGFATVTRAVAMKALDAATEALTLPGGNSVLGGGQVDIDAATATIGWNRATTVRLKAFHSLPVRSTATYGSNDASVPADQQPATKWGGKAASGVSFSFKHTVSTSPSKPAGRDLLSFLNVDAASTWGLSGASTVVTASRSANGVTLTGSARGSVSGGEVPVVIDADLPEVAIKVEGAVESTFTMLYSLTDAAGASRELAMKLTPVGGFTFHLPVEEAVGVPQAHSFQIKSILAEDGNHNVTMQDASFSFPVLTGVMRGRKFTFPVTLKTNLVAAK